MVKRYGAGTVFAVLATVLIWSTTFAAMKAALAAFSPAHLLFLRWTLTSLLFAGYALVTRMRLPEKRDLPTIVLAGLLGFGIYQILLVNGQTGVSASLAGFLVNLNPVFTTVISVALGRERSTVLTWAGLAVALSGLVLMAQGRGGLGGLNGSAALVIAAALCFSLYTIVSKPLLAKYRPLEVTTWVVIAGSLPLLVFAPGSLPALAAAPAAGIANLVFLAVMPGAVAYALWSKVVSALPAGTASRTLYALPVLGIGVSWLWVGEVPHLVTVAGGLVTIAGVALASIKRPAARLAQSPASFGAHATSAPAAVEAA